MNKALYLGTMPIPTSKKEAYRDGIKRKGHKINMCVMSEGGSYMTS